MLVRFWEIFAGPDDANHILVPPTDFLVSDVTHLLVVSVFNLALQDQGVLLGLMETILH